VKTGGFGDSAGVAGGGTGVHGGAVRTGGFNDSTVAPPPTRPSQVAAAAPTTTPVQVLFKPKPVYSAEARTLKLEGQVALEVVFGADGSVRVVHVIRGLGHGLDEAAQQAATQVKFRPATKDGAPVDTSATIYITFELT
jgi:TonB family protein